MAVQPEFDLGELQDFVDAAIPPDPSYNAEFMDALALSARLETARHLRLAVPPNVTVEELLEAKQNTDYRYWWIDDILTPEVMQAELEKPPIDVDTDTKLVYLAGGAVELGHPEYDRILSEVMQGNPSFRIWKDGWVAEEQEHGQAMVEWARLRRMFDRANEMRKLAFRYVSHGSTLSFQDAADALGFPCIQEVVTELAHQTTMLLLPKEETVGRRLMGHIVGDEGRHAVWNGNMVRHALHSDDRVIASYMFKGLVRSLVYFGMPAFAAPKRAPDLPPEYVEPLRAAYAEKDVFSPQIVLDNVVVPLLKGEGRFGWDIANIPASSLDDPAKQVQELTVKFVDELAA
jgi:hypothetical protein